MYRDKIKAIDSMKNALNTANVLKCPKMNWGFLTATKHDIQNEQRTNEEKSKVEKMGTIQHSTWIICKNKNDDSGPFRPFVFWMQMLFDCSCYYRKAKVTKTTLNINASKLYYFATPTLSLTHTLSLSIHRSHRLRSIRIGSPRSILNL